MGTSDTEQSNVRRLRSVGFRILRMVLLIYLGVLVVYAAFQNQLIFPGQATQGRSEAVVRPLPGEELVRLQTKKGDSVVALFGPALTRDGQPHPDASARPTLLYFYGNGMCLADSRNEFDAFRRVGINMMIPEYVGYGMSSGSPSEANCYATADAAWNHLRSRPDVRSDRILVGGWSLGSAVAVDLAAREPVAGLMILSSFTSAVDVARMIYPLLPARLLLRHRFESLAKIPRVQCPILIGHGSDDRILPSSMSDRLADAAGGPVTQFTIPGADHNDFYLLGEKRIMEELERFVQAMDPGTEGTEPSH